MTVHKETSVDKEKVVSVFSKCKKNKTFLKIKIRIAWVIVNTFMGFHIYYYFYHLTVTLKYGKKNWFPTT